MNIYVAGNTHDWPRVRSVMQLCREYGHVITYDWTQTVEAVGDAGLTEGEVDRATRRECAQNDVAGVRGADLLIVLDHPNLTGTLIEVGIGLATESLTDIWLVGFRHHDSVFFDLPKCQHIEESALPAHIEALPISEYTG